MIADVVRGILSNFFILLFAIAILTTIARVRRAATARKPVYWPYLFWGEVLFYSIGIGFLIDGALHAYAQPFVAPLIGWQPSPFEYELGWLEIALAVVAMMALWRGFEFRLAATIAAVIFALAAAAQHIQQIACCHNVAPDNAGLVLWFGDLFVPVVLIVLASVTRSTDAS